MKILIIGRGYPTPAFPMNGIFEWDQARALAACGHSVVLGAVDLRSFRHLRLPGYRRFVREGVQVESVQLPAGRISAEILHRINTRAVQSIFAQTVKTHGRPDVVHSHFLRMGTASVAALAKEKVPLVHTEHFSGLNQDPVSDKMLSWGRATYPKMAQVAAVSTFLAQRLAQLFQIDAAVIPNPVDLTLFKAPDRISPRDGFHLVSTGHLLPNKRMDLLIAAFHQAFPQREDVDLTIFGSGPELSRLKALIASGPAALRIQLAGHQPREKIAEKMQASQAFVLLSQWETFGLAYVEALACGLPILAADSGGPRDFIRPETGRILSDDSVAGAAAALIALEKEHHLFDRMAISRFAHSTYSSEAVAKKLLDWYTKAMPDGEGEAHESS